MRTFRIIGPTLLVLALSTVSSGVAEGVAAEAARPLEVAGGLTCSTYWQAGDVADVVLGPLDDGNLVRRETRGFLGRYNLDEMSDPRLLGRYTARMNMDEYVGPEPFRGDHLSVWTSQLRIENEAGAWQGQETAFYLPGTWEPITEPRWDQLVLTGEGDYAGKTALLELRLDDPDCYCWSGVGASICTLEVRGLVLDGDLPPMPEADA
jgi:hypothetical protein